MNKGEMMHIIYDPQFDEYGVLMNENFKKVLKKTHEDFAKVAPTLGDEFVFSTGGEKIAPLNMDAFPKEILNSDIGLDLLNKIRKDTIDIAQVDQEPSLEGRQLLMVLSPSKKN